MSKEVKKLAAIYEDLELKKQTVADAEKYRAKFENDVTLKEAELRKAQYDGQVESEAKKRLTNG